MSKNVVEKILAISGK